MTRCLVLYDADCGLCTRFKTTLDFVDARRNLDFMSIDQAEQTGLLDALPDSRRHQSFHLILPDRRIESGEKALPSLIRLLPGGRLAVKLITSAPKGQKLLDFVYAVVSRLHETGSCKMQDSFTGPHVLGRDRDRLRAVRDVLLARVC